MGGASSPSKHWSNSSATGTCLVPRWTSSSPTTSAIQSGSRRRTGCDRRPIRVGLHQEAYQEAYQELCQAKKRISRSKIRKYYNRYKWKYLRSRKKLKSWLKKRKRRRL